MQAGRLPPLALDRAAGRAGIGPVPVGPGGLGTEQIAAAGLPRVLAALWRRVTRTASSRKAGPEEARP